MFQFFKNIFSGKPVEEDTDTTIFEQHAAPKPSAPPIAQPANAQFRAKHPNAQPAAPAPVRPPQARPASNGSAVHIPLQAVLNGLPIELRSRVRQSDVGEATLSLPLEKVLAQLSAGSVKISFGDLRRAAPHVFSSVGDYDQVQVPLPLNEILAQINPAMLVRRQDQRCVEVPDEVSSPFGDHGQSGAMVSPGPSRAPAPVPAPVRHLAPPPGRVQPPPAVQPIHPAAIPQAPFQQRPPVQPAPFQRAPIQPTPIQPAPVQPAAAQPAPTQQPPIPPVFFQRTPVQPPPAKPAAPAPPVQQAPIQPAPIQPAPIQPVPIQPAPVAPGPVEEESQPVIPPSPALRGLGASLSSTPAPAPAAPQGILSRDRIPHPAEPTGEGLFVNVSLSSLAEGWPEALRQEIIQLNLAEARVALPADVVGDSLKRGKVAFQWKTLRSWIRPAPSGASVHENAVLELPLQVITPLFLSRQKEAPKSQQKVAIDENIPNLFFGFPQAEASAAAPSVAPAPAAASPGNAVTKPVDTNYYVWDDSSDSARVDETDFKRKTPGTQFVTRYATPNEVVSRAAALDGVAGALIALPDGLMVASRLAQDLNGDTLAAFLPHIFGKVSQCTKELRMGDLNNLNFTVGNIPWKIFRVNAIFFAAFGRVGQPLPTAQLAALAAELDHKKQ